MFRAHFWFCPKVAGLFFQNFPANIGSMWIDSMNTTHTSHLSRSSFSYNKLLISNALMSHNFSSLLQYCYHLILVLVHSLTPVFLFLFLAVFFDWHILSLRGRVDSNELKPASRATQPNTQADMQIKCPLRCILIRTLDIYTVQLQYVWVFYILFCYLVKLVLFIFSPAWFSSYFG